MAGNGATSDEKIMIKSEILPISPSVPSMTNTDATRTRKPVPFYKRDHDPFNGKHGYSGGYYYRRPNRSDFEDIFGRKHKDDEAEYRHRDVYGRVTTEKRNVLQYISPTESEPKPLMVQATTDVFKNHPAGDWRRVKIKSSVSTLLTLSEWALAPKNPLYRALRVILVDPVMMIILSLPLEKAWEDTEFQASYTEFPNYCWDYPKHARNRVDARPGSQQNIEKVKGSDRLQSLSSKVRLLRPRQLIVRTNGEWKLEPNPAKHQRYIFISFYNGHFTVRPFETDAESKIKAEATKEELETIAQARTEEAGLDAYWVDFRCTAPDEEEELHTADVHRMCDVIRGAYEVCVILRELSSEQKQEWGARMWTLPEALLAKGDVKFCAPQGKPQTLSKLEMSDDVWNDGDPDDGRNQPTRLLAEHYSNVLTLGRLELFSVALEALQQRSQKKSFSRGDIAYALMGLLHNRIQLDQSDSLFQALAQLSLANDSDRLMERMICMFPEPVKNGQDIFVSLTEPDQFDTQLWDVEPLCQVAGVGERDGELILDGCRGVSIRWKSFPQMKYKRSDGFRKLLAELVLRSGALWFSLGLGLMTKYIWSLSEKPNLSGTDYNQYVQEVVLVWFGALAIVFSFLLALGAPSAVRRLYGGKVMQSAPWLVGFEGTMPVEELERNIFGNSEDRLTYEPSSTIFCERDPLERLGVEPLWVKDPSSAPRPDLPKGHRLFTLVDTGSLTVSIFSAVRPPSVALICGREGGMLRTVLCHYERSNNCLYKETVMRMDSMTLNMAKTLSWIKISLGQNLS